MQLTAPAIVLVPFTVSVQVPGQEIEPNSHARATAPVIVICPATPRGAQMSMLEHARSPAGHQVETGQLVASRALGAREHGAANHVKLKGASTGALGGQACSEHGGDPNSVEFCHISGLNYVSCSPYRVPIARLAAAQAFLKFSKKGAKEYSSK